ncbi:MAG: hypothetical protein ACTH3D_09420 [Halomonas sp.]|uniref:hypothetical protein n=1 Tax=Halomonas sp. TaxID=1486246 RepID=UPI003F912F71
MNHINRLNLNSAALTGDQIIMEDAGLAVSALAKSLSQSDISPSQHEGLLTALEIIGNKLLHRAEHLQEMLEEGL